MSQKNGRFCPNNNCVVVMFRVEKGVNQCPQCSSFGMVVTKFSMKIKVN